MPVVAIILEHLRAAKAAGLHPMQARQALPVFLVPQVHMPVVDVILEHLQAASAAGRGDEDWSALAAVVRQRSGRLPTGRPQVPP